MVVFRSHRLYSKYQSRSDSSYIHVYAVHPLYNITDFLRNHKIEYTADIAITVHTFTSHGAAAWMYLMY